MGKRAKATTATAHHAPHTSAVDREHTRRLAWYKAAGVPVDAEALRAIVEQEHATTTARAAD